MLNRRVRFWKLGADPDFDETLMEILAVPASNEHRLLDIVEKAGGDEDVRVAVAAFARLREALPTELRKTLDDLLWPPEPTPKAASVAVAKKATPPPRSAAESLQEVKKIVGNIQRMEDEHALERLEKSAEKIRKESPKLTKEQAFIAAMQENPEDVAGYVRHHARGLGYDPDESVRKAEGTQAVLDRAARPFLAADPTLTREQAITKALRSDPTLYERSQA